MTVSWNRFDNHDKVMLIGSSDDATAYHGTAIYESGTMLNSPSQSGSHTVDVLAEYNDVNAPDLLSAVGWTPTFFIDFLETQDVMSAVEAGAGPFNW